VSEPWTVFRLVKSTADVFSNAGVDAPRVEAEWLLSRVLSYNRTELYMNAQRPVTEEERSAFRALVTRRLEGEPLAYILGERGFWTLDLAVDPRVLIPRPETEQLVELALRFTKRFDHQDWRIIDVGTGSGALALALASELPQAVVVATDLSPDALEVAKENAERLDLRERVKFVCTDVLDAFAGRPASVDIVVSNPPYIGQSDPEVADDVRAHEPEMALFSGDDGLDIVRRLLPAARAVLRPGGLLLMEHGARQGDAVRQLARADFATVSIQKDLSRHDRVLVALAAGESPWPAAKLPSQGNADGLVAHEENAAEEEEAPIDLRSPAERALLEAEAMGLPVISLDDE
jgi:release factor glutamine methyltransferase